MDRDSNVGHFEEFDLEAVERSIREKSRNLQRQRTSTTPATFFDDDGDDDNDYDVEKDRQSWQLSIRPSVSVKNIAKLFESSSKLDDPGTWYLPSFGPILCLS